MIASGDCIDGPKKESTVLVEKIVVQQLRGILNEVLNISSKRTSSLAPTLQDFEILMRNNQKCVRMRRWLKKVHYLKSDQKQGFGINFLNKLAEDNTSDDEQEIYDEISTRRMFRADKISQELSAQKYEEFQKARSWSSNIKNKNEMMRKLADILQVPKEIQLQENSECLEILLYLTIETIACIVDYSILTRLNSDNHITESFNVSSSITSNILHLCPEVTQGRGRDGRCAITVQEINEAIRRVSTMQRRMGTSYRSTDMKIPFLAL